jgi:membrane associated rhomboid family serine protease
MYAYEQNKKNWISQFWDGSILQRLIVINVGVYILVNLIAIIALWFNVENLLIYYPNGDFTSRFTFWLSASSSVIETLQRPWSPLTYMFLHEGLWHLLFNMIMLFFAGQYFVRFFGQKRLLSIYIFGGLSGLGLYMLIYSIVPYFYVEGGIPIMGASASVMAIFIAIAAYQPNTPIALPFVGQVKLKYIAIFYLVLDFANIRSGVNAGGHIAHLGGALYGYYAIFLFKNGKDIFYDLNPILNAIGGMFKSKSKLKVKYKASSKAGYSRSKAQSDYEYNANKKQNQERVDEILDKISKSGYDSLNKEEKDFLFHQSTKNQH